MPDEKDQRSPTCNACGLLLSDCICPDLQPVDPGVEIRLLIHNTEFFRQSNTGRLAHLLLKGSQIVPYGAREQPLDPEGLAPAGRSGFLLYPGPHAEVASEETLKNIQDPFLVVLDGSWSQTRNMYQRNPVLHGLRKLSLPPGPAAVWTQRRPPGPNQYCTLEALILLMDALGKSELSPALWQALKLAQARLLRQRGLQH